MSNKRTIIKQLSFTVLLFWAMNQALWAQVFKCEAENGKISFSDEPCAKGESSSRLNWLKGATSTGKKKYKAKKKVSRESKTAKKAKKENEAYVLLSLLTTTQLELETASLRSSLNGERSDAPELILSDGIIVDLLKVDKIILNSKYAREGIQARFIMDDGYSEVKILKKPYPVISGSAKIGRFSKSLDDIKQIEFFNSKKLLKLRAKQQKKQHLAKEKASPTKIKKAEAKKTHSKSKPKPSPKVASVNTQSDTPVIELDLTAQVAKEMTTAKKKPQVKVVAKSQSTTKTQPVISPETPISVRFTNDKVMALKKQGLSSSKGKQKKTEQYFILSEKEKIAYADIKAIKIRPTSNKASLIVAIELKSKEIRMEVMSRPFTRIIARSRSSRFDHSLLEIKAINF